MELIKQQDKNDCGPANCTMIINHFLNKNISLSEFKIENNYHNSEYSLYEIKEKLSKYNIETNFFKYENINELKEIKPPFILVIKNDEGLNHYVNITKIEKNIFEVYDPNKIEISYIPKSELEKISLNYVGILYFKKDKIKTKKDLYWFSIIFKIIKFKWKEIIIINLMNLFNLFIFLLSSMFIRVLLNEYRFLTIDRIFIILMIFIVLILIWLITSHLISLLTFNNNKNTFIKLFKISIKNTDLKNNINNLSNNEIYKQIINYNEYFNLTFYLLNNILSTILFTVIAIFIAYKVSLILMLSTILFVIILLVIKSFRSKKTLSISLQNKYKQFNANFNYDNLVNNFKKIEQKMSLESWIDLNKEQIFFNKNNSLNVYSTIEKIITYLYYSFMIFITSNNTFDISSLLVVSNIVFVYSNQIEKLMTNILFLKNINKEIIKFKKDNKKMKAVSFENIIYNKKKVISNYIEIKELNKLFINYVSIEEYIKEDKVYVADNELIDSTIISNNLFNFGNNEGIELFSKLKLYKYLDKLNIDLSNLTNELNDEQKDLIKLLSVFFNRHKIIMFKETQQYDWYVDVKELIISNLKNKLVVILHA